MNIPFDEVVLADFEFNGRPGNRQNVVCLCWREMRSGRSGRLWHDQLGAAPPYRIDNRTLFVAFYASAELQCHLVLGWPLPENVLDLFAEFRCTRNHSGDNQDAAGLLDALDHFKISNIGIVAKEHWREVIIRADAEEIERGREGILDYCWTDIDALDQLLPHMPVANWCEALLRGAYMKADAHMVHRGIPIDKPLRDDLATHWDELRGAMIDDLNTRYPVFEKRVLKHKLLAQLIETNGISYWPRTPSGQYSTEKEVLRAIAERCPEVEELCSTKITLNQLKTFDLAVGDDWRNRCMLSAFRTKTGRNAPSNSEFVFGLNAAFRSLIKPGPDTALVYLDFGGQEFAIASYLSGDKNMIAAYETGDPYSDWARRTGGMPAEGKHPHIRAVYKRAALGVLYGMGARTMAEYVGVPFARAKQLLRSHREFFPRFWQWSEAVHDAGIQARELFTVFGWRMRVRRDANERTLRNYPMQGNGAEMLRLACIYAIQRDVPIIAPVHDAILIEAPRDSVAEVTAAMVECMKDASRVVLGGPTVRVDVKDPLFYPDRYIDGRGEALWANTLRLLDQLKRKAA
jgi:DNA polymerase-1